MTAYDIVMMRPPGKQKKTKKKTTPKIMGLQAFNKNEYHIYTNAQDSTMWNKTKYDHHDRCQDKTT